MTTGVCCSNARFKHLRLFGTCHLFLFDTLLFVDSAFFSAGIFAIEILAQCPGGGWRTLSEWKEIFATQDYKLEDIKAVGASMHLMVWGK